MFLNQILALDDDAILRPDDPLDQPALPLVLAPYDHHVVAAEDLPVPDELLRGLPPHSCLSAQAAAWLGSIWLGEWMDGWRETAALADRKSVV